jgi:hypothetical protein
MRGSEGLTMADDYIRFDEVADVLASLEMLALVAPTLCESPFNWKWAILGAHSAMQGAMVCAYEDSSDPFSILTKTPATERWEWLQGDHPEDQPAERLEPFLQLFKKCIRGSQNCEPLLILSSMLRRQRLLGSLFPTNSSPWPTR